MITISLLLLARALHVMGGIVWAGSAFVLAFVIIPLSLRQADPGASSWSGQVTRKVGPLSGIAALITVISGIYLFATLHRNGTGASSFVLQTGALAAILSMLVGALVSRPAGQQLARLKSGMDNGPDLDARIGALQKRMMWSSRLTMLLLILAVLAMALFRYAQAFA